MSKRFALSFVAAAVVTLVACGSNPASKYCSVKSDCDGSNSGECETAAAYGDLTSACQINADLYYNCLWQKSTCGTDKVFVPSPTCDAYGASVLSCKARAGVDAAAK